MIVLYTTLGCHLCDKAKQVIYAALGYDTHIHEWDIADDDTLMEAYALKIPVLRWEEGEADGVSVSENAKDELCWPFDAPAVQAWFDGRALI